MSFLADQPWAFECPGKDRPQDRGGMKLHVWKRNPDGTATCSKCDLKLTVSQANDCFTDRR